MAKTIIESVREYFKECPHIDKFTKLNINFLPKDSVSYSIEEVPSQNGNVIKKFLDGSSEREFNFVLASMFDYSEDLQTNIENSGFFEGFQEWIEENNNNDILPQLKNGYEPISINVTTTGYLFFVSEDMKTARYQIQLKLIYEKEK